ncbi:Fc.00g065410.m01.CDS01 [Cosmosporella sp. VM-42]
MMSSSAWDGQDQAMTATSDDDFHQFLDMSGMANLGDGMQFDFQGFQDGSVMSHAREPADTIMGESENNTMMGAGNSIPITTSAGQPSIPAHMMTPSSDAISTIDAQIQYLQQQKFQQQQRQLQEQQAAFFSNQSHSVPPTPQSLEMPNGQFYSQAEQLSQQGVYDRGYSQRVKDQEMAFTPLVSPAVTPLDPHFSMDNVFTTPGAYFSPLTSPALHAQNDSVAAVYDQCHSNNNNSPVEMELETSVAPVAATLDLSKKPRKKAATKPRNKPNVRSSPIVKAQRRKTGPSPAIVSQVLSEVDENNVIEPTFLPMPANSTETSAEENSSVSPENLSDMPPPPVPTRRSTSKSPYIQAQNNGQLTPRSGPVDAQLAPATPASLMKLPASKSNKSAAAHTATDHIESLELPDPVSNRPLAPSIVPAPSQSPRVEPVAGKTASFQPLPSPVFTRQSGTLSASASPQLLPGSTGPSARKTPQLAPRSSRKRSTGSVHVSPALLPRISPSIKPLLPGTPGVSLAEDAASRLLMTKSNYQNILEGNTVPGVSYPSELSTNLTSKRTSHKIAEQGRRNRINSALQVMAGLLPGGDSKAPLGDDDGKKDGKNANAQNSKASVVESAIVHMQKLEQENVGLKAELDKLKKQLEELKGPVKEDQV